jgi:hypothetical protein
VGGNAHPGLSPQIGGREREDKEAHKRVNRPEMIASVGAAGFPPYAVAAVAVLVVVALVLFVRRYWPSKPPADKHVRTPSDVLHLIVGVLLVLLGLLVATGASNTLVGFERDLIGAFDSSPGAAPHLLAEELPHVGPYSTPAS